MIDPFPSSSMRAKSEPINLGRMRLKCLQIRSHWSDLLEWQIVGKTEAKVRGDSSEQLRLSRFINALLFADQKLFKCSKTLKVCGQPWLALIFELFSVTIFNISNGLNTGKLLPPLQSFTFMGQIVMLLALLVDLLIYTFI